LGSTFNRNNNQKERGREKERKRGQALKKPDNTVTEKFN
jgi:hypothetical protein